jgi:hypothetical protein
MPFIHSLSHFSFSSTAGGRDVSFIPASDHHHFYAVKRKRKWQQEKNSPK